MQLEKLGLTWIQVGIFFFFFTGCAAKGTPQTPTIYIQNHKPQTHVPCINNSIFTQTLQTEIFFLSIVRNKYNLFTIPPHPHHNNILFLKQILGFVL